MSRLPVLAAGILSLALAGCTSPNISVAPPPDRRITLAADLAADVLVTDVRCVRDAGGYLEFQANVVNNMATDRGIEWRIVWLDANGLELPSAVSNWAKLMVSPKDIAEVRCVAASQAAADFRFHLRRLRR